MAVNPIRTRLSHFHLQHVVDMPQNRDAMRYRGKKFMTWLEYANSVTAGPLGNQCIHAMTPDVVFYQMGSRCTVRFKLDPFLFFFFYIPLCNYISFLSLLAYVMFLHITVALFKCLDELDTQDLYGNEPGVYSIWVILLVFSCIPKIYAMCRRALLFVSSDS